MNVLNRSIKGLLVTNYHSSIISVILLYLFLFFILICIQSTNAEVIVVTSDGSTGFQRINQALENASDGDIVRVYEGTYFESLIIEKSITLIGNSSANTIISGDGGGTTVEVKVPFVNIYNLTFRDSGTISPNSGIVITEPANGCKLGNISVTSCYYGIQIQSHSNIVSNANCHENSAAGIWLTPTSELNTLCDNYCSNNRIGMSVVSDNNHLKRNTFFNNDNGELEVSGDNNKVFNNEFISDSLDYYSINMGGSKNNEFAMNRMNNGGFHIWGSSISDWNSHTIHRNNSMNDMPIYYFTDISNFQVAKNFGQLILANCYNISIANFSVRETYYPISVGHSKNILISDNIISDNNFGIFLSRTTDCVVANNTFIRNNKGVYLDYANAIEIHDNLITKNNDGIYVLRNSEQIRILNNNISGNKYFGLRYVIFAILDSKYIIDAGNNWWGHTDGPFHPQNNSEGFGDEVSDHVEFIPWIGHGFVPFNGNTIYVDDDAPSGGNGSIDHPFNSIQCAILFSRDYSIVLVMDGIYSENLDIYKPVTITSPDLKNTTLVGDGLSGAISITSTNVKISGFTITMSTTSMEMAGIIVRSNKCDMERLNITNYYQGIYLHNTQFTTLRNISANTNIGSGIFFNNSQNNTVMNFSVSNSSCGVELFQSDHNSILDGQLQGCGQGIVINQSNNNDLTNLTIINNSQGIAVTGRTDDQEFSINNSCQSSSIRNNTIFGIIVSDNGNFEFNATKNYWGHDTGPYHNVSNPLGSGDNVSDHVAFIPWLSSISTEDLKPLAFIISISPNPGRVGDTFMFSGTGTDDGKITRYRWISSIDGEFYNDTSSSFITNSSSALSIGNHMISFQVLDDIDQWSGFANEYLEVLGDEKPNSPPIIIIYHPRNYSKVRGYVTFNGSLLDEDSAKAILEMRVNGERWILISQESNWTYKLNLTEFENGRHVFEFKASDGENSSNITILILMVDNGKGKTMDFPEPIILAIGIVMIGSVGVSVHTIRSENLRYLFNIIFISPLYSKLKKNDILHQNNRNKIYTFILYNPGANYTYLKNHLKMGSGTLAYHLSILEREEYITSNKDAKSRTFIIKNGDWNAVDKMKYITLSKIQLNILQYITDHGACSPSDLKNNVNLSRTTISYSLKRLKDRGLIYSRKSGKFSHYYISEDENHD